MQFMNRHSFNQSVDPNNHMNAANRFFSPMKGHHNLLGKNFVELSIAQDKKDKSIEQSLTGPNTDREDNNHTQNLPIHDYQRAQVSQYDQELSERKNDNSNILSSKVTNGIDSQKYILEDRGIALNSEMVANNETELADGPSHLPVL